MIFVLSCNYMKDRYTMRLHTFISTTLFMACAAQAQLYHGEAAPLLDHMREVNAQWELQGIVPADADRTVSFTSEAERIATHLHLVRETLAERNLEGLSSDQARERAELLDRLEVYANGGVFPINRVLPYRNPVFIDPYGTACAVGQLMIESGHVDLAERISADMNTGYLLEIVEAPQFQSPVSSWANEHGFTADELAWIQPGYPPSHPWAPLGEGTNGPVTALLPLTSGDLLVAGNFTEAGGTAALNVAIWDGASYAPLGNGVAGDIVAAVEFNGDIYVGGSMLGGNNDLAHWDGTQWTYHTIFEGKLPWIDALHVHDGALYAAGQSMGFAGVDHMVRRVNNDFTYTQIGSKFNAPVLAMETYLGFLIVGGEFTGLVNATDPLIAHLAQLEGNEWGQLFEGTDAAVRTLLADSTDLYIGGDLYANIAVTFGLAKISSLSPTIELLLPGHADYISNFGPAYISSMTMLDGDLYFAGNFNMEFFTVYGNMVAKYEGTPDAIEPMIAVDAPANAITSMGNQLIVGGDFSMQYPHIVTLDITTGITDRNELQFSVSPNPVQHELVIDLADHDLISNIEIIDASGHLVAVPVTRADRTLRVNVKELAQGSYVVRANSIKGPISTKFVKE